MPKIASTTPLRALLRSGFSLIELIVVILIASLVSSAIFSNVNFGTKKQEKVGIHQLKKGGKLLHGSDAELVCLDHCRQCFLKASKKSTELPSQLKPLKAYILDDSANPQEIDFGRIKGKKVCLRFHYYPNGSTSQMILESDEKFYFVPSYFGDVEVFGALDAAVERWTHYRSQLDSMGTFF